MTTNINQVTPDQIDLLLQAAQPLSEAIMKNGIIASLKIKMAVPGYTQEEHKKGHGEDQQRLSKVGLVIVLIDEYVRRHHTTLAELPTAMHSVLDRHLKAEQGKTTQPWESYARDCRESAGALARGLTAVLNESAYADKRSKIGVHFEGNEPELNINTKYRDALTEREFFAIPKAAQTAPILSEINAVAAELPGFGTKVG